jgi:hypothetical protein
VRISRTPALVAGMVAAVTAATAGPALVASAPASATVVLEGAAGPRTVWAGTPREGNRGRTARVATARVTRTKPPSIVGSTLFGVTYRLLLHNEALPALTRFWKAVAGKLRTAADRVVHGSSPL